MKKIILIAAMVLGFAAAAVAQPRAVGLKLGWGAEASYQHTVGGANFVEATLGLCTFNAVNASATYNFMIAQPSWTSRGEWGFYAGPGAAAGWAWGDAKSFHVAAAGQVGLEYTFWVPLQLSIDVRPQLGYAFGANAFYWGVMPSLGVRYKF